MLKRSFLKRPLQNEEMSLQITSMADVFIIILVFLLKSYATGTVNLNPGKGMLLPEARLSPSEATLNALKVEIFESSVQLESQSVSSLNQFQFFKGEVGRDGVSAQLSTAFEKERSRQLLIAKNNSEVQLDPRLIVLADQKTPYETIKTVLASAALHGYTDFKLAVVH